MPSTACSRYCKSGGRTSSSPLRSSKITAAKGAESLPQRQFPAPLARTNTTNYQKHHGNGSLYLASAGRRACLCGRRRPLGRRRPRRSRRSRRLYSCFGHGHSAGVSSDQRPAHYYGSDCLYVCSAGFGRSGSAGALGREAPSQVASSHYLRGALRLFLFRDAGGNGLCGLRRLSGGGRSGCLGQGSS